MNTAEIEAAANRGNIATADFFAGQVLRRQIIPQFLEDVGPCSWRKRYKTITTVAGDQDYDLDTNCLKIWEAYRLPSPPYSPLKYIGEDPLAVSLAEATTTQAAPTGYYMVLNGAAPSTAFATSTATLVFSAIVDGAVGVQTFAASGATAGGQIIVSWPATLPAGVIPSAVIISSGTVEVRLLNMSGATLTPTIAISYYFLQTITGVAAASWQAIKFQAPPDGAYSVQIVQLTYIPFVDDTTSVNLLPYIPEPLHWALVAGLRAQIFFDRFGQGDPRYDRAQAEYGVPDNSDVGFSGWIGRARRQRELGRRNYFVSVR